MDRQFAPFPEPNPIVPEFGTAAVDAVLGVARETEAKRLATPEFEFTREQGRTVGPRQGDAADDAQ